MAMARHALRKRREQQGWTQERLAYALGVETVTYRSWEAGRTDPRPGRRPRLAEKLGVTLAELNRMLNGEQVEAPDGLEVDQALSLYVALEQGASRLWGFQGMTFHALLQTREYAVAVERVAPSPVSDEFIARRVERRLSRQRALTRSKDPLWLSVVLDESVLYRVTGGPKVMAEQLAHVVGAAGSPNVDIRILPLAAGVHTAAFGAFTVLSTTNCIEPQVVCIEDRTSIRYVEEPHSVEAHMEVFEHLVDYALPVSESIDLIRATVKEKYQ